MRVALALCLFAAAPSVHAGDWKAARPDYAWSFPRDHWARDGYKTEWWYFTGHLASADGRRFGYQFTFFRVGMLPRTPSLASEWATGDLIMGHAAIGDPATGRHLFSEVIYRVTPLLGGFGAYPDTLIAWSRAPAGTDGTWTLRWNGSGFDFSMTDSPAGNRIFAVDPTREAAGVSGTGRVQQKRGTDRRPPASITAFTRLATTGEIRQWAMSGWR